MGVKICQYTLRKMVLGDKLTIREGDEERADYYIGIENDRLIGMNAIWRLVRSGLVVRCVATE